MKYINTQTGAVVDFKSKISGGYWQPLVVAEPPKKSTSAGRKKKVKECNMQQ